MASSRRREATDSESTPKMPTRVSTLPTIENPTSSWHREGPRCQRIAADLFERLHIFDRDGRIDGTQLALDYGHNRARVCRRPDDQMFGKCARLPQRKINLGIRRPCQLVGAAIGHHANDFGGRLLPAAQPELLPDHMGMRKEALAGRSFFPITWACGK